MICTISISMFIAESFSLCSFLVVNGITVLVLCNLKGSVYGRVFFQILTSFISSDTNSVTPNLCKVLSTRCCKNYLKVLCWFLYLNVTISVTHLLFTDFLSRHSQFKNIIFYMQLNISCGESCTSFQPI